jgi:autotransporter translocation and assembly factor TamB
MTASMPFRPAAWVQDPKAILDEPHTARADLPRLDLARYASIVPRIRKLAGVVTGQFETAGPLGKPAIHGRIDLAGGSLETTDARIAALTGVNAGLDLAADRVTLRDLRAVMSGGTLRGAGSLALERGKPAGMDLRITGDHLPVLRDDSMIIRANADLRLTGTFDQASLTGTVGVVDSLFYRDIELLPIGTPFTTPSAAALPKLDPPAGPAAALREPFRDWNLDVRVHTVNPFLIRGNFATGQVTGSLRLGGTLGNPAPDGTIKVAGMKASLPFSTLNVRSGSMVFTPATGFDPILEIRGSADPRPYRVNAFVYGRASDPQLVLTSSPPLPENEIMTLLATGTVTSGLENPQAASSRAMQLLVEELRRGRFAIGKQLRPVLGLLDRVDFSLAETDPYSSESFSTATLSITDRWFLSAGMGADGDTRVLGIWRLTFH